MKTHAEIHDLIQNTGIDSFPKSRVKGVEQMTIQTKSKFKVFHHHGAELGLALMNGNRVTFECDPKSFPWFEKRPHQWLRQFKAVVRKLCRSAGHSSKFSIREDINSSIRVERITKSALDQ